MYEMTYTLVKKNKVKQRNKQHTQLQEQGNMA